MLHDLTATLERLYTDSALRETYGRKGREFAEMLDWDVVMPQWIELLDGIDA